MRITNRRARAFYNLFEKYQAGLLLKGSEIKSIRAGRVALDEAYVKLINQEAYLINAYFHPFSGSQKAGIDPKRTIKLLLNRNELITIASKLSKGMTIVPLAIYIKRNLAKLEIALAKSKKQYDRRDYLRKKAIKRDVERELRGKD